MQVLPSRKLVEFPALFIRLFFIFCLYLFISIANAQPIQITQSNVPLYLTPGKNETAFLINQANQTYTFLEERIEERSNWLKIRVVGWIWKKSTNYTPQKQQMIVIADNENFRSSPNKAAIAQLKYNTPLSIIKGRKNWVQASLIVWLDATMTNYQPPVSPPSNRPPQEAPIPNNASAPDITSDETTVQLDSQSPPLVVKRIKLPPTEPEAEIELPAEIEQVSAPESFLEQLKQLTQNQSSLLLIILALLSLLLLLTFILVWRLSTRISRQQKQQQLQQQEQITKIVSELQSQFSQQLIAKLDPLHDSTVRGLEKNKGEIAVVIERRMAEFNEKLLNNLSTLRVKMGESLNHSTRSQAQAFSNFQNHLGETVNISLKRNLDSLNQMFNDLRQTTDQHMKEINHRVEERLKKGFEQTNQIFIDIKDRLNQIDQAQKRISELSNNVVSLQKTLDNKGARGAFGEVQLVEIVKDMIPAKFYKFQHQLSNDKRPDCIIFLPPPTGKLIIDAKFPLENYKLMFSKDVVEEARNQAASLFKRDIKKHIRDISDKYIIPGETANGAVMFIPSEAVFAEIHAHHPDLVKQAQLKHVWMTSPTTLMALLTTARAVLADDERSKQAKIIHEHLNVLAVEFGRFSKRMDDLAKHINMAHEDVNKINISAKKITDKFEQIENTDLEELPKHPSLAVNKKRSA